DRDLAHVQHDIANLGYAVLRTEKDEIDRLHGDPGALQELFVSHIRSGVGEWMRMAADRMDGSGVPIYLIPGNDDPYEIDSVLATSEYCLNVDGRVVDIEGDLQVLGSGKSNPTPWSTPREVPDDD